MLTASGRLLALLVLFLTAAISVQAKHETGFLDRTLTLQGTTYKYQVFIPDDWTSHQKWPVILFLHGSGERGEDGMDETDVGIGTAIRSDRGHFHAIVVMPQCRKNIWWTQPPDGRSGNGRAEGGDARNFTAILIAPISPAFRWAATEAGTSRKSIPHTFAAMVIICGGIHPPAATLKAHPELVNFSPPDGPKAYVDAAAKIGKVPVWIFHGGRRQHRAGYRVTANGRCDENGRRRSALHGVSRRETRFMG